MVFAKSRNCRLSETCSSFSFIVDDAAFDRWWKSGRRHEESLHVFSRRGRERCSISGMNVVSRPRSPARMLPLIAWVVVCDEIKNASVAE